MTIKIWSERVRSCGGDVVSNSKELDCEDVPRSMGKPDDGSVILMSYLWSSSNISSVTSSYVIHQLCADMDVDSGDVGISSTHVIIDVKQRTHDQGYNCLSIYTGNNTVETLFAMSKPCPADQVWKKVLSLISAAASQSRV